MGSERGTRLCSDQRARDNKGQTDWGDSQISEKETAGGWNGKTAGTIRNERGKPGQSQMERAMARKDKGDPNLTDGDGKRARERWAELEAGFDLPETALQMSN